MAWLLSRPKAVSPQANLSYIGFFVPLWLSFCFFLQTRVLRHKVFKLASYILRIEAASQMAKQFGWETQLASGNIKRAGVQRWENTIWLILCGANAIGAVLVLLLL
ncbi:MULTISPECIES: hypothetical protein [Acidobacteriaceae]|uniref:hypothetical protein n=1 Tax=Acidobacteriaceae TaxID=204434 RepID=UPI00131E215E|nr:MULTISPECIES: hypothetical protein [Acidobacteriaceae]MDW5266067.1 hypothetical protein [Edaphobacter sp.]